MQMNIECCMHRMATDTTLHHKTHTHRQHITYDVNSKAYNKITIYIRVQRNNLLRTIAMTKRSEQFKQNKQENYKKKNLKKTI